VFQSYLAFEHYFELDVMMQGLQETNNPYKWFYIWGNKKYSLCKVYKHIIGTQQIIILMCESIWSNAWIFNNIDPSLEKCKKKTFKKEFILVMHWSKESVVQEMKSWLDAIM
jgi:hypothetical protein